MIKQYDSIAALRADYIAKGCFNKSNYYSGNSWYGDETPDQTLLWSETGNTDLVLEAESYLNKLNNSIETKKREIIPCVAGGWPSVPDAIVGRPTSMRKIIHTNDEHAPITIYVSTDSSGGYEAKLLKQRGIVILALTLALSRTRPINLYQLTIGSGNDGETVTTAKINTSPLDLATACYALTSQGFSRRMTYNLNDSFGNGSTLQWPRKFSPHNQGPYLDYLRNTLSTDPKNTLVIGPAHLVDELVTNPLAWINKQIDYFTNNEAE